MVDGSRLLLGFQERDKQRMAVSDAGVKVPISHPGVEEGVSDRNTVTGPPLHSAHLSSLHVVSCSMAQYIVLGSQNVIAQNSMICIL